MTSHDAFRLHHAVHPSILKSVYHLENLELFRDKVTVLVFTLYNGSDEVFELYLVRDFGPHLLATQLLKYNLLIPPLLLALKLILRGLPLDAEGLLKHVADASLLFCVGFRL